MMFWLNEIGMYDTTVEQLASPADRFACYPYATGPYASHNIDLRRWRREGMVLLGRVLAVDGRQLMLAPDLEENLAKADSYALELMRKIDDFVLQTGLEAPAGHDAASATTGEPSSPYSTLNLAAAEIASVIWATGYAYEFGWIHLPVFDVAGYPVHRRGVTAAPGLYFMGLPWLHTRKSALLFGAGEDAAFIASAILERRAKAA
jgi:putative flavoprotein involved in K+ transport